MLLDNWITLFSKNVQAIFEKHPEYKKMDWVKELVLRKRETERLEYINWLKRNREESITSMAYKMTEDSPAYAFHDFRLKVIRHEVHEAETEVREEPNQEKLKEEVMRLVIAGKLESALQYTYEFLSKSEEYEDFEFELIHHLSEFNQYEEKERKGVLDQAQISLARNNILNSLLSIIKEIGT